MVVEGVLDSRGEQFYLLRFPRSIIDRIHIKQLQFGDFIVKKDENILAAVERKTGSDLHSSLLNGRLQNQLKQLKVVQLSYLLIEGKYEISDFEKAVLLCYEYNIKLVIARDQDDTVQFFVKLFNKCQNQTEISGIKSEIKQLTCYQKMITNLYGTQSEIILQYFKDFPKYLQQQEIYTKLRFQGGLSEAVCRSFIKFVFG